jgi:hypothetical protein
MAGVRNRPMAKSNRGAFHVTLLRTLRQLDGYEPARGCAGARAFEQRRRDSGLIGMVAQGCSVMAATATGQQSVLDHARAYLAAGLSIIPIWPDGTKSPTQKWGQFQKALPTAEDLVNWFRNGRNGIALVCGRVSGNREVLDLDHECPHAPFVDLVEREVPGLLARLPLVQSPNGYHYHYNCPVIEGNLKLAMKPGIDPKTGKPRQETLAETRGEGGYILLPGSPAACHPTHRLYEHIAGPPITQAPVITPDERQILFDMARSFDLVVKEEAGKQSSASSKSGRPGDDFDQRATWKEILEPKGWHIDHVTNGVTHWRRPGKERGSSATTGHCGDRFYVFTSNSYPFESGTCYRKFAAYTWLYHAKDFGAAASALRREGYGGGDKRGHAESNGQAESSCVFCNYTTKTIIVNEKEETIKRGLGVIALGENLRALTDGWPKRVSSALFVEGADKRPLWLDKADALLAWIGGAFGNDHENAVRWIGQGEDKVSQAQFFAYLQQRVECFKAVEAWPHWPLMADTFYMHPAIEGGNGRVLAELLDRFEMATLIDRDLLQAFFMTLAWGGIPGQRPAFLFTTEDDDQKKGRGVGKSIAARAGAWLFGGLVEASDREDMGKIKTRLLSPLARSMRLVLLDNLKTLRFSWGELEATITSDVISGHELYEGEGQRPNTLTWTMTINGASLSRDMAQRTIVVKLKRPNYSEEWIEATRALIETNRWQIVGDIMAILKRPATRLPHYTRWASWEGGVLARLPDPRECQKVIAERQEQYDDDAQESALVRDGFRKELRNRGHPPDLAYLWISSAITAEILDKVTGEHRPVNKASAFLATLSIPELRKCDYEGARGWVWRGRGASTDAEMSDLSP